MIKSWELGVNTTEPMELVMDLEEAQLNVGLSATQSTLLQHEHALERMLPKAEEKGVGSPFSRLSSTIFASVNHSFDFAKLWSHDYFLLQSFSLLKKKQHTLKIR
ncbi:hypothetical protein [Gracilibacillus sp. JCM 18860]|uniref:hypothetical protein n=1 Tax=Gracilibacillus sp. JCM 18860 TaxID=1306159 RepID=UPI0032614B71